MASSEGRVELIPLRLPVVFPGSDLIELIIGSAEKIGGFRDGDVVVVSSKVVSAWEGRWVRLKEVKPSREAVELSAKVGMDARFVELVLRESDEVLGHVRKAILTIKKGCLLANAGIDRSNVPKGVVSLLPADPVASSEKIRDEIRRRTGKRVGVVISDSTVKPLRRGTVGIAVGWAGLEPVEDCRGKRDLFGKKMEVTFRALADQLATAAQLLMGETKEQVPVVVVRGMRIKLTEKPRSTPLISSKECLYFSAGWARRDSNPRPPGYEPDALPG